MTNQENRATAFRTDCRLVNMKQEYPGYTGKAKWMLVSSLPESEVMERYEFDELSYLCWTDTPEASYVLEYNPDAIPDEEILKMAESAEAPKDE